MLALVTYTQAVCTVCQSEIRRDCIIRKDIAPKRNFITWPRQRVECVCPNCRAAYRFTWRMEPGQDWQIEGDQPKPITDEKLVKQIRAKFPAIG